MSSVPKLIKRGVTCGLLRRPSSPTTTHYYCTTTTPPLPVIDVSSLIDPSASPQAKLQTAGELHEASQQVGFFYLKNHSVPEEEVLGKALRLASQFFQLPPEVKESISIVNINKQGGSPSFRGYQKVGDNVTQYSHDLHEAIDMHREDFPKRPQEDRWLSDFRGVNPFLPDQVLPGFHEMFSTTYIQHLLHLGNAVMRGFAIGFGLPEEYFVEYCNHSYWCLRIIRYPPLAPQGARTKEGMGCGEHCDYGCLTFLNVDPSKGFLQVQTVTGEWVFADPIPGTLITNIGDMLSRWSNGKFRSTPHRVLPAVTGGDERISIPFFFEPNVDAIIRPLPCCERFARAKGQHYEPVRFADHLRAKLTNNFSFNV